MGPTSDDSPLRRITSEASLLGGAGYAVLLQIAHPSVAQGVRDHSDFSSRPLDRLRGTLYYVYGLAYGTEEERERVRAIVLAMHRKVTGPTYRALDPDLLLWVAATLFHSGVRLYELTVRELGEEEFADYLDEASVFATALGLPADEWPASPAEFDVYWAKSMDRLEVGEVARGLAAQLFRPANPLLWPLTYTQRFLSGGLLPPELREQYGIPWSPGHQRGFDLLMRTTRRVYPHLPDSVRALPATLYLRSLRGRKGWLRPNRPKGPKGSRAAV
ncbi:oxygenase MpaB family protein [Nocardiopsis sp. YSL2]|uniref:oxygenase MpaB family protein n=1 Tax=Nocardiopsis sp. YSL2 TaxID=2939492 RepID=UPI0026F464F2|nr:oxygenase MpaB family protein [Nocardiopsis sp. YSL2]